MFSRISLSTDQTLESKTGLNMFFPVWVILSPRTCVCVCFFIIICFCSCYCVWTQRPSVRLRVSGGDKKKKGLLGPKI